MGRALLVAAVTLVIVVVVVGLVPGMAGGPGDRAIAGPETPVPVGALGSFVLSLVGMGALLWRSR